MGIVSPVGSALETAWSNIREGRSGITPIEDFDVSEFATRIAGSVQGFNADDYITSKDSRRMDRFMHYGIGSTEMAIAHAGFEVKESEAERIGVAMGSGIGGLDTIEVNHNAYLKGGPRKISPFYIPGSIGNMVSGHVSIRHGITGPNLSVVTACSTSTHCIGIAGRLIQYGDADVMIAGGAEFATTRTALGGFCSARAMSTRNDDPEAASRPFDQGRDGFVLSNGAGTLILEELEYAKARNATIYGELIGFGMSGDAHHITSPPPDGEGARKCMAAAMNDAGIDPSEVDYLNAHGTSTPIGDLGEVMAIKRAFGDSASDLAVSSTKSMTGHMLGAAGVAEAIFSLLALRDQVLPPTINLDVPDSQCDLDLVPHVARDAEVRTVMSNSFGFGGTNGSLVFRLLD
jgi:3-oxoacyl-[acyl-carrier-protein] synthase II